MWANKKQKQNGFEGFQIQDKSIYRNANISLLCTLTFAWQYV